MRDVLDRRQRSLIHIPRYETSLYLTSNIEAREIMNPLHCTVKIHVEGGHLKFEMSARFVRYLESCDLS